MTSPIVAAPQTLLANKVDVEFPNMNALVRDAANKSIRQIFNSLLDAERWIARMRTSLVKETGVYSTTLFVEANNNNNNNGEKPKSRRAPSGTWLGEGATAMESETSAMKQFLQSNYHFWDALTNEITKAEYMQERELVGVTESLYTEFKGSASASGKLEFAGLKRLFYSTHTDANAKSVGQYVCGFLNSPSGGGTMYLGVHDTGVVQGVECSSEERDEINRAFDDVLSMMDPPVNRSRVTLQWRLVQRRNKHVQTHRPNRVKSRGYHDGEEESEEEVMDQTGYDSEAPVTAPVCYAKKCLYVVVVNVTTVDSERRLFWFNNDCFIRKEGSLTKMPPPMIRERMKEMFVEKMRGVII